MKKRMEENDKMEKEIQERKKDCFKKNELGPNPYFDHPLHVNAHRLHN